MRKLILITIIAYLIGVVTGCSTGPPAGGLVKVIDVEGEIVPIVADYISRGLDEAETGGYSVAIIKLSTPGGLYTTTQDIVRRILEAKVPVVVYVPPGSWAASAGTFITLASNVAAMAPGSRMGAAHPVGSGGDIPEDSKKKITEDAAAWIRSIAESRGRDPAQAELAVTESRSYTDSEAFQRKLIDLRVRDLDDLLVQLEGRKVTLADGRQRVLSTVGGLDQKEMNLVERLLQIVSNPNVAYILLSLASIGLIVELSNPGLIFPGVVGGVCLLLAFYSLGVLNASWSGVMLFLLGMMLFVLELFITSHGILTAGGVAALTIGSLMLFSGAQQGLEVNRGLIAGVVVFFVVFFVLIIGAAIRGMRRKPSTGRDTMIGETAVALTPLDPVGSVLLEGERWQAEIDEGTVEAGQKVVVNRIEGLKVFVSRKPVEEAKHD